MLFEEGQLNMVGPMTLKLMCPCNQQCYWTFSLVVSVRIYRELMKIFFSFLLVFVCNGNRVVVVSKRFLIPDYMGLFSCISLIFVNCGHLKNFFTAPWLKNLVKYSYLHPKYSVKISREKKWAFSFYFTFCKRGILHVSLWRVAL